MQTAPQIDDLARHREDSPGYTNAIINLLLYLREKGIDINEIGVQGVSSSQMMLVTYRFPISLFDISAAFTS